MNPVALWRTVFGKPGPDPCIAQAIERNRRLTQRAVQALEQLEALHKRKEEIKR